jgi:hypothetical protein
VPCKKGVERKIEKSRAVKEGGRKGVSSYRKLKVEALDRTLWRTGLVRGNEPAVRQTNIHLTAILKMAMLLM